MSDRKSQTSWQGTMIHTIASNFSLLKLLRYDQPICKLIQGARESALKNRTDGKVQSTLCHCYLGNRWIDCLEVTGPSYCMRIRAWIDDMLTSYMHEYGQAYTGQCAQKGEGSWDTKHIGSTRRSSAGSRISNHECRVQLRHRSCQIHTAGIR